MKTSLRLFAAIFAVLGAAIVPVSAQTQSTTVQLSKLVGTKVKSSQGEEIGVIKDVVIDRNSGCMAYTVLSTTEGGGHATGGGKLVAVPWAVYSPSSDVSALTVSLDRERIYHAPVFDYARIDEYSRPDYITNIYSYYGVSQGTNIGVGASGTSTTTTGGYGRETGHAEAADSPPSGTASPASTSPAPTRSPAERESPASKASPRPRATPSPHTRGEATVNPSSRKERENGATGRPAETASPSGGAELEGSASSSKRESQGEESAPGETRKATPSKPHRKLERRESNTPPPDDGSGEHRQQI